MAWGLEIAPDRLRLCRAELRRGHIRVHRMADASVPPGAVQPSIKETKLADAPALIAALSSLRRRAGCRGWVRVTLPDPLFLLRTITTDQLPDEREAARRFLCWQARDLLPFPAEQARLDYLDVGPDADGRARLVCLVARNSLLADYERALQGAGFRAGCLDARSVSLAQATAAIVTARTAGLLTGDVARATLLLIQDGRPRHWRILMADGAADGDQARLIRDVADSLAFFQESEGIGPLDRLLVHGMGPRTDEIASGLARWLELPVSVLDLAGAFAPGTRPGGPAGELTRWGAAIGAAIRPW
jgi:Tfp pilus assembly PilM family ATPase